MLKYFLLSILLFLCGMTGLFSTSKYMMLWLLSLELIFLAMNFNFVIFSLNLDDMLGQFYMLSVLVVAAAESAIGLSMLVIFYSISGGMSLDLMNLLKG